MRFIEKSSCFLFGQVGFWMHLALHNFFYHFKKNFDVNKKVRPGTLVVNLFFFFLGGSACQLPSLE